MSDSLWPHGLQHARLPCPSPTPGAQTLESEIPRRLFQYKWLDPISRVSHLGGLEWSPKTFCISNKLSENTDASGLGTTLWEPLLDEVSTSSSEQHRLPWSFWVKKKNNEQTDLWRLICQRSVGWAGEGRDGGRGCGNKKAGRKPALALCSARLCCIIYSNSMKTLTSKPQFYHLWGNQSS